MVKVYKDPIDKHLVRWKAETKARELIKEEYMRVMKLAGEELSFRT